LIDIHCTIIGNVKETYYIFI